MTKTTEQIRAGCEALRKRLDEVTKGGSGTIGATDFGVIVEGLMLVADIGDALPDLAKTATPPAAPFTPPILKG